MREDILGAIKNAMERGSTAQQAARSLINSGYNQIEVNEALAHITRGSLTSLTTAPVTPEKSSRISTLSKRPVVQALPKQNINPNSPYQPKKEAASTSKIILLSLFLFILVIGLIATIFFKDEILSFISP